MKGARLNRRHRYCMILLMHHSGKVETIEQEQTNGSHALGLERQLTGKGYRKNSVSGSCTIGCVCHNSQVYALKRVSFTIN